MRCEKTGDCALQELAYKYDVDGTRFEGERWDLPVREANPFITYEPNKCILCGRCTRICNEVVMAGTIDLVGRGFNSMPDTAFRRPRTIDNCEFCGQCVSTCPTGALTDKKGRGRGRSYEMKKVRTTCSYCGTGCNFDLNVKCSVRATPINRGHSRNIIWGQIPHTCLISVENCEKISNPFLLRRSPIRRKCLLHQIEGKRILRSFTLANCAKDVFLHGWLYDERKKGWPC